MDLSPWNYWNKDRSPRPDTPTIIAQLEGVLAKNPNHPGACHYYIHAVEATEPTKAVACAERLAALMPGAGHMVHMPGHIYIRVGRYNDAIMANEHAVHTDMMYMAAENPGPGVYYHRLRPAQLPLPGLCGDHGWPEQGGDRCGEEDLGDDAV